MRKSRVRELRMTVGGGGLFPRGEEKHFRQGHSKCIGSCCWSRTKLHGILLFHTSKPGVFIIFLFYLVNFH